MLHQQIPGAALVISVLWAILQTASGQLCPYGWVDYPGSPSCYLITDFQVRYFFDMAVDRCHAHQAQLIRLDTKAEVDWLNRTVTEMSASYIPPRMAWWVGLDDKGQGEGVVYLDGSKADLSLLSWPTEAPSVVPAARRCVSFVNGTFLTSAACTRWLGMICERPKALPVPCDVDDQWTFLNDTCYKFFTAQKSWDAARRLCQEHDAQLAKVETEQESHFLWDMSKLNGTNFWIGLKSQKPENKYRWSDGSSLNESAAWWAKGEPKLIGPLGKPLCGQISGVVTRPFPWVTQSCSKANAFACSKAKGVCADGWLPHQSKCVKFFPKFSAPWPEASLYCQALGGDLLIIPSESYQSFINIYLKEQNDGGVESLWIGLSDQGSDGTPWSWADGSEVMAWNNWGKGQPASTSGHRDCGYIRTDDDGGTWRVSPDCAQPRSFACMMDTDTVVNQVDPPAPPIQCQPGWEIAGTTCIWVSDVNATWYDAQHRCDQLLAHLLVVNTTDIQSFLEARVASDQYWIGLNDRLQEGQFVWENDAPLKTSYWAKGEPNNLGDENCVVVSDTDQGVRWMDVACSLKSSFICQTQPGAVRLDAPPTTTQAPYSARCGELWEERPSSDMCYQFRESKLSWLDALDVCQRHGGSLVSILSQGEQSYIAGRLSQASSVSYWIGASDRLMEAGWRWEDGSALAYLNWFPGEPNDVNKEDCAAISTKPMEWYDYPCEIRASFICKKPAEIDVTTQTPPLPTSPIPDGKYFGCQPGWLAHQSSCFLVKRIPVTWLEGQASCRQLGAELASVSGEIENDFVWSQLPKEECSNLHSIGAQCDSWAYQGECQANPIWMATHCRASCALCSRACVDKHTEHECAYWANIGECSNNPGYMQTNCARSCGCDPSTNKGFWLGLNDRQIQMTFVWSDLSPVTFTHWMNNEPNNFNGTDEDCVTMHAGSGQWSDESCDQLSSGYVCKKPMTVMDTPTFNPQQIGCPVGGFGYESSCYIVVDVVKTWQDANDYCRKNKGNLVTITNRITGAFITSELVDKTMSYWIGLSSTNGDLTWSSGQMVDFTDWDPSYNGSDPNACVALRTQRPVGLWEVLNCQELRPFICELWRRGYPTTTTSTTTTSTATTMTANTTIIATASSSTTTNSTTTTTATTIGINSTIVVPPAVPPVPAQCPTNWKFILDKCYRVFTYPKKNWQSARDSCRSLGGNLASIHRKLNLHNYFSLSTMLWIGLNDIDIEKNFKWSDGTPLDYKDWAPGEPNDDKHTEDCVGLRPAPLLHWNDAHCEKETSYICALKPSPPCVDPGWHYFGGSCYFISVDAKSWYDARRVCQASGGDLASITSDSVTNFLIPWMKSSKYWNGLNQLGQTKYRWSDGTPVTYKYWANNEPNDAYGGEMCVGMLADNGLWVDDHCAEKQRFVCKKLNDSSSTVVPTQAAVIPGVCPDGFFHMGVTNKCFYIGGVGSSPKLSWTDARDKCRNMTSPNLVDIATISSRMEQDVATVSTEFLHTDIWIGLNNMEKMLEWRWQDNSEFLFNFWASATSRYPSRNSCVKMLGDPPSIMDAAHWKDESCSAKHAYLCQTLSAPIPTRSALATTPQATTPNNKCPPNFFNHSDTCFSVVKQPKSWKDARTTCQAMKGELASTLSVYEVARLDIAMAQGGVSDPAWIGLYYDVGSSRYQWTDNWPMTQTFWTSSDPDFQTNSSCVAFSQGLWNDTSCSELRPFVCETRPEVPSYLHPKGDCPIKDTAPFDSWCYLVKSKDRLSMPSADYSCAQLGMQLVSVHSRHENDFVRDLIRLSHKGKVYFPSLLNIWLGFQRDSNGAFRWSDGSLDDFFNWKDNEPSSKPNSSRTTLSTYDEQCVEMDFATGQWDDKDCLTQSFNFVCKSEQILPSTVRTTTATTTPKPTPSSTTTKKPTTAPPPSKKPTTATTTPSSTFKTFSNEAYRSPSNSGMSPGKIAGTIIGVLGAIIIAVVIAIIMWNKKIHQKPTNIQSGQSFANALYTCHVQDTNENAGVSKQETQDYYASGSIKLG